MSAFLQELVLAGRTLRKSPGFFAAAVLSLALGIAANSTIFAAIDAFLIRPLPYDHPDRLMQVWNTMPERGWDEEGISVPDFADWQQEARLLKLAAYRGTNYNLVGTDTPERVRAYQESNLFPVLGVTPLLGRGLGPADEELANQNVAVLSHRFWQRRFNGDSTIVGRVLLLSGQAFTVVGVMGPRFLFPRNDVDLWTPLPRPGTEKRDDRYLAVVGRIVPGSSEQPAATEMAGIADRLARSYPETNAGVGARILPLTREIYDDTFRQASLICTVAVAFVLLIACANVANLLLARGAVRGRELGIRAALGAGRWRLVRQMLAESLLIALSGGLLGLLLSYAGVKGLVSMMPPWFPRMEEIAVNARLLVYTIALSLTSGLVFGLAPALQSSGADLYASLRETGRSATAGAVQGRLRKTFVIAEIALALVLLIAAGLLIKASIQIQRVDLGFEPRGVMTARVALSEQDYPDSTAVIRFYENLVGRLHEIQGVTEAGASTTLPMNGGSGTYYTIEGEPQPEKGKEPVAQYRGITPGYLEAMNIPVRKGRTVTEEDRLTSRPVVLVNEAMVRRHWPSGEPLGHRIVLSGHSYEIIGVVADAREFGPDDETPAIMFFPESQSGYRNLSLVVRSSGDPARLAPAIREAVRAGDAGLPIYDVQTMQQLVINDRRGDSIMPKLLGIFGGVALVLAVLGVYSVMAYTVAQRTREVGIRMALGAEARDILGLVVRQGSRLTLAGIGIGLLLAAAVTRALSAFLFGVSAFDPVVFGGVTAALLGAALLASFIPAQRASRVDPVIALRRD